MFSHQLMNSNSMLMMGSEDDEGIRMAMTIIFPPDKNLIIG
jgi:hypothetical protein